MITDRKDVTMLIKSPSIYIQRLDLVEICGPYLKPYSSHFFFIFDNAVKDKYQNHIFDTCIPQSIQLTCFVSSVCTHNTIRNAVNQALASGSDGILGFGAEGTLNLAKAVGFYTNLPVILIPSQYICETCVSSKALVTNASGETVSTLTLSQSPSMILADTGILAESSPITLANSMARSLATYPDIQATADAVDANLLPSDFVPLTSIAFAKQCYDTILKYGKTALNDIKHHTCTQALEKVTEAVLFLGSMAEENSKPSMISAIRTAYSAISSCKPYQSTCYSIGILLLMVLQNKPQDEINKMKNFLQNDLELPVCLTEQITNVTLKDTVLPLADAIANNNEITSCLLFSTNLQTLAGAFLYLEHQ